MTTSTGQAQTVTGEADLIEEDITYATTSSAGTMGGYLVRPANAAGPLASYDGALFWKTPETALTLNFETSNAGTQNTPSEFATSVSNTWTKVAFFIDGIDKVYPILMP